MPTEMADNSFSLQAIQTEDIGAFVAYWNEAFADRRSFAPIAEHELQERILNCPAFDPSGLILAWRQNAEDGRRLSGFVHAFRPPPKMIAYNRWGRYRTIAALHVAEDARRHGLGSRLLRAAEDWLYYCPIHFAGQSVPCYGGVEGPRKPFYGSTQRMGVDTEDKDLLQFLSRRGYQVVEPGDISMTADIREGRPKPTTTATQLVRGVRLERVDHTQSFPFREPGDRREYESWIVGNESPYSGLLLVDEKDVLCGHLCWYPMPESRRAGIYAFWLTPVLRGKGLGALLLDTALADMSSETQLGGPFDYAEVQSHLVRHDVAVALYESRGFTIDAVWVNLVKT